MVGRPLNSEADDRKVLAVVEWPIVTDGRAGFGRCRRSRP